MKLTEHFMNIAREELDAETFDRLYAAAVERTREHLIETKPVEKTPSKVIEDVVDTVIAAANTPKTPHVIERLEERFDFDSADAQVLANMIRHRDKNQNIELIRTSFQKILECEVRYRKQEITVIYNDTTGKMITAYPKNKKKKTKKKAVKQKQYSRKGKDAWSYDETKY